MPPATPVRTPLGGRPSTDREIAESLADYLPPEELVGLAMAIRAELARLRQPRWS